MSHGALPASAGGEVRSPGADWLIWVSILAWVPILLYLIALSYAGTSLTEQVSFRIDDGWCPDGTTGVGQHCWADFGFPYQRGGFSEVYTDGNMAAANTPLTVLTFEYLRFLPYRVGLAVVLLVISLSILVTAYLGSRHMDRVRVSAVILVAGIGTAGSIASLDRANWIGTFPILLYVYAVAIHRGHPTLSVISLGLLVSLKFWAIILVIPLLVRRQWVTILFLIPLVLMLYVVPLSLLPGSWDSKWSAILSSVFDREYGATVSKWAVSIPALFSRFSCVNRLDCDQLAHYAIWPSDTVAVIVIIAFLVTWATWMAFRHRENPFMAIAPTFALIFLAVPEAAPYNLVASVAISALLFRYHTTIGRPHTAIAPYTYKAMIAAIALTNLPIAASMIPGQPAGALAEIFGIGTTSSILIPLAWLFVIGVSLTEGVVKAVRNRASLG